VIDDAIANATSGESMLTMSEAVVDTDEPKMYVPVNSRVKVSNILTSRDRNLAMRMGPGKTGTLRTLMILVTDSNNDAPDASAAKLKNDIFDDDVSLKKQTEASSYGKLKIKQTLQGGYSK
jgi:hypothetical protein